MEGLLVLLLLLLSRARMTNLQLQAARRMTLEMTGDIAAAEV
jgi:hypothetical protein